MNGIKTVLLFSHKPAHTPDGSDHKAENSIIQMYSQIEDKIPKSIKVYEIAAHNHFMAKSDNNRWYVSGAGGGENLSEGKSSSEWPLVNTEKEGYLKIKINDDNGKISSAQFYDLNGKQIH
jgi:hypothetical protein